MSVVRIEVNLDGTDQAGEGIDKVSKATGNLGKMAETLTKRQQELRAAVAAANAEINRLAQEGKSNLYSREGVRLTDQLTNANKELIAASRELVDVENKLQLVHDKAAVSGTRLNTNFRDAIPLGRAFTEEQKRAAESALSLSGSLNSVWGGLRKIAYLLPGIGLAGLVGGMVDAIFNADQLAKAIADWATNMKQAEENSKKLTDALKSQLGAAKKLRDEGELIGLSGSARTASQIRQKGDELSANLLEKMRLTNLLGFPSSRAKMTADEVKETEQRIFDLAGAIRTGQIEIDNLWKGFASEKSEEAKKRLEDFNKTLDETAKRYQEIVRIVGAGGTLERFGAFFAKTRTGAGTVPAAEFAAPGAGKFTAADLETARSVFSNPDLTTALGPAFRTQQTEGIGRWGSLGGLPDDRAEKKLEDLRNANSRLSIELANHAKNFQLVERLRLAEIDKEIAKWKEEGNVVEQLEKQKQLVMADTNLKIAEDAKQRFEKVAHTIEQFFDRVFLHAKSFGDVWKQLWTQMIGFVVKQFSKMVAAWWTAHRTMSAAARIGAGGAGAGGSIGSAGTDPGNVLSGQGALAGSTGGGFSGFGTPPFIPPGSVYAGRSGSVPYTDETGSVVDIGGSSTGAATGAVAAGTLGLRGSLAKIGPQIGVLAGLGLTSAGVGRGNLALGGLGGAVLGGSAAYLFAGSKFGAGILGTLGLSSLAFAGIGAGIGLTVGLLLSARTRNKQKRLSASVHEDYLAAAKRAVDDFERHRTSYDSAVSRLGSVYDSAVEQLRPLGKPGRRTIDELKPKYEASLRRLDDLQRVREYRSGVTKGLPIPSFATGGIVPGPFGKPVLMVGHAGEGVLNQRATAAVGGKEGIERLNRGDSREGGIHLHFHGQIIDRRGLDGWIRDNQRTWIHAINRMARDRGMRPPI
jgi:hypothetical protein